MKQIDQYCSCQICTLTFLFNAREKVITMDNFKGFAIHILHCAYTDSRNMLHLQHVFMGAELGTISSHFKTDLFSNIMFN